MTGVPVHCPHCDALFRSRALKFENSRNITITGSTETCIRCGKRAHIISGTFDAVGEALKMISGPDISRDMLRRFEELVEKAQKKEISIDDLEKKADKIDRRMGDAVRQTLRKHGTKGAVFVLLLAGIRSCHTEGKVDWNRLYDQLEHTAKSAIQLAVDHKGKSAESHHSATHSDGPGEKSKVKGGGDTPIDKPSHDFKLTSPTPRKLYRNELLVFCTHCAEFTGLNLDQSEQKPIIGQLYPVKCKVCGNSFDTARLKLLGEIDPATGEIKP